MELFRKILAGCEADVDQPLIAYLRARDRGEFVAPYVPTPITGPLHRLCKHAIALHAAGFKKEAGGLVSFLNGVKSFLPLWCPEKEYNEEDSRLFYFLSNIEALPECAPQYDLTILRNEVVEAAFTSSGGTETSLGMISAGGIEVRALGPQGLPLSQPNRFGIRGEGDGGWSSCYARPEVWLNMKPTLLANGCKLKVQFVGLTPDTPMAFAFYVKAPICQAGDTTLRSKTLNRFNGEINKVLLGRLKISSSVSHKVQIIPLAGFNGFWNSDFLVSFEIHPIESQMEFFIGLEK